MDDTTSNGAVVVAASLDSEIAVRGFHLPTSARIGSSRGWRNGSERG
jgi:hypothetical protein